MESFVFVISSIRLPDAAADMAAVHPAMPAPMMSMSDFRLFTEGFLSMINLPVARVDFMIHCTWQ
jgi:hypothetical protein